MRIQPVQIRSTMAPAARQAKASQPMFGYEPKDPKPPGWGDKFDDFKRKITPGFETRQDLKKIGIGGGVIIAGNILAGMVPVVGPAIATIANLGGGLFGAYALMSILGRRR